jgi:Uncharacterized protein conserved in bacteria
MSGTNEYEASPSLIGSAYFPPSWQGLRQQIVYLAQFGNSIQVIHADAGGGKSTFFAHLLQTGLGSTTIGVTVAEGAGLAAFFHDVLEELGLRPSATAGLGELVAALRGFVQTLHKERARAVLLVDDAHRLTDSELGALVSTLQGQEDAGVGLHVVLFATPGFAARIDALQVLDVAVHDAPLPVFSVAEIQQLLQMRQPQTGALGAEQIQSIWYQSRGLPGAALAALDQLRPASQVSGQVMSLRGLPMAHIAALVVLCGVLVWAFLVRDSNESHQHETPRVTTSPVTPVVQSQVQPVNNLPEPVDVTAVSQIATPDQTAEVTEDLQSQDVLLAQDEAGVNLEKNPVISEPQSAPEAERPSEPAAPAVVTPPPPPSMPAKVAQSPAELGAARLLAYPANAYVLQLMAASAEDKLAAFIASQPNKHNLLMYKTERDGKLLFILVEGFYADKASAEAAIANLPAQQRSGGPWPKRIEQVHQEVRKSR